MSNYKKIAKESNVVVALVVLCQNYILYDDALTENKSIKKNLNDEGFWIELSKHLYGSVKEYLEKERVDECEYDEFEDAGVTDAEILEYVLNTDNRLDFNDMIFDTVDNWIKMKGKK